MKAEYHRIRKKISFSTYSQDFYHTFTELKIRETATEIDTM